MIIINWAVYNQWFLSKGLFWKANRSRPFPLEGFGLCRWAREGRGLFGFFLLSFLLGKVATAAAQLGPQNVPHPVMWPEGQAAWFRLQDSTRRTLAGDSLQPVVACTVCPGLLLLQGSLQPRLSPHPVFPARSLPAGWWSGASGEPTPDRMAVTGT